MGLILIKHGFVDFLIGISGPGRIGNSSDLHLPALTELARVIHKSNVPCFMQLGHSGTAQHKSIKEQPVAVPLVAGEKGVLLLSGATIPEITDTGVKFTIKEGEHQELTVDKIRRSSRLPLTRTS